MGWSFRDVDIVLIHLYLSSKRSKVMERFPGRILLFDMLFVKKKASQEKTSGIPYLACCRVQSCLLFLVYHPRELTILNGHLCECWQIIVKETVAILYKARHGSSMFLLSGG